MPTPLIIRPGQVRPIGSPPGAPAPVTPAQPTGAVPVNPATAALPAPQQVSAPMKLPTPPPPPAEPAAPDPADQFFADLKAGEGIANEVFADGSFGRISDPRAAETSALITAQKARLGGLTEQEQEAARMNAIYSINAQANESLRGVGNMAAGRGLRGGVVQGENAKVLGNANAAYGDAVRNVLGIQNQAQMSAAGDLARTLGLARDIDTSIQHINLGAQRGELMGRLSMPFEFANLRDTYRTGDAAESTSAAARAQAENTLLEKTREEGRRIAEEQRKQKTDTTIKGRHDAVYKRLKAVDPKNTEELNKLNEEYRTVRKEYDEWIKNGGKP